VTADDLEKRRILEISVREEELDIDYPEELSGLIELVRRIAFLYVGGSWDDSIPWRYRYEISRSGENDQFPYIYEDSEYLNEIYDKVYQQGGDVLENHEDSVQSLAAGLLGRISSIARSQLEPVNILSKS